MRSLQLFLPYRRGLPFSSAVLRTPPEKLVAAGRGTLSSLLQPECGGKPDEYALSRALNAAQDLRRGSPDHGRRAVQSFAVKLGFCRFTVPMTALMTLAIRQGGDLQEAVALFDELPERDVVSWTSLIVGYAQRGYYQESLALFRRMISSETQPNSYSFSGALSACSGLRSLSGGREIHARLLKESSRSGIEQILQNNLLNLYSRCQDLSSSEKLFGAMPDKDVIAWNEMISCYLHCGMAEESLNIFAGMISSGIKPDRFTYATCADVCAYIASLRQGTQLHAGIIRGGIRSDLIVGNALVDMYARCGAVDAAELVFAEFSSRDAILWTTMIAAYARGGFATEAVATFEQMLEKKMKPDDITFLAVLSACSHGGLVTRGWDFFRSMKERHGISAKPEHYSCLVDLLCRSGRLDEASLLMKHLSSSPTASMRTTFLNSCRLHGSDVCARAAGDLLAGNNLVALSNAYAAQSDWNETGEIRSRMKEERVKKEPGCSWVETIDGLHVFVAESRSHPEMHQLLQTLRGLNLLVREI